MTRTDLERIIKEQHLDAYKYNLWKDYMGDEEYGILHREGTWQVYITFERGGHNIIDTFRNENDACLLLLRKLRYEKQSQIDYLKFKEEERKKRLQGL